ncbi:ATP-binding protein [Streptomyces sp. SLBN-118]|uniref:ATP-binding protein n=1 Tax=Streptomyces sp. SLBN-118 TaxID=2768454 RepID=UPI00135B18A5|nr:ATP-binding protein [Streptomyces sp. SLBN-118]
MAPEPLIQALGAPRFRYEMTFRTDAYSVPATRRAAKAILVGGTPDMEDDCLDRALLIITELVANTVKHAARRSPRAELTLVTDDRSLTIAVHDTDPGLPRVLPPSHPDDTGGRGLRLVHDLASEVDGTLEVRSDPDRRGKAVRVSLPL